MANEELIMQLSVMEQQSKQIEQQLQLIDENIIDLENLKHGLEDLKDSNGKEIFASIGRGIFIKAKIENSDELLTDVGGKHYVKKNIPSTQNMIDFQIGKLNNIKSELLDNLQEMNKSFQEIIENIESEGH